MCVQRTILWCGVAKEVWRDVCVCAWSRLLLYDKNNKDERWWFKARAADTLKQKEIFVARRLLLIWLVICQQFCRVIQLLRVYSCGMLHLWKWIYFHHNWKAMSAVSPLTYGRRSEAVGGSAMNETPFIQFPIVIRCVLFWELLLIILFVFSFPLPFYLSFISKRGTITDGTNNRKMNSYHQAQYFWPLECH